MKQIVIFSLIVISLLLVSSFITPKEKYEPIDFVYTWVDEYDPERDYYKELEGLERENENNLPYRFNQKEELRYSLRSIMKYMNWVNNIYIVVKDGQCPNFINFNHPRIKLVNHSEFIPKEYLPTFNCNTIEHYLHKIPGLSDRYIYFNDDIMVNTYTTPEMFFDKNGLPKVNKADYYGNVYYSNKEGYDYKTLFRNTICVANKLTNRDYKIFQLHSPSACYKPWEYEMEELLKERGYWNITRFRSNKNIAINNLFRTIYYLTKGGEEVYYPTKQINLVNDCSFRLDYNEYDFLCFNTISEKCSNSFREIANELFPEKSDYEITTRWD